MLVLLRARERAKDQSYALALIPYATLGRARFPLGDLAKEEVREQAMKKDALMHDAMKKEAPPKK